MIMLWGPNFDDAVMYRSLTLICEGVRMPKKQSTGSMMESFVKTFESYDFS